MARDLQTLLWSSGNFRPVLDETDVARLEVRGSLPAELEGVYVRTGPNPVLPFENGHHWFDGDGMLHAVVVRDGRASYRNRYVRTRALAGQLELGRPPRTGLRRAPDPAALASGAPIYGNTANTAVLAHHGHFYALCEFGLPYEITLPALRTIGERDPGAGTTSTFTAHPKVDPASGELIYLRYQVTAAPYLAWGALNACGTLLHETPVDIAQPSMMHDFAVTADHVVLPVTPLVFDIVGAAQGRSGWVYRAGEPTRIGLASRRDTTVPVRWFETSGCSITHVVNACETASEITLHGVRYARPAAGLVCHASDAPSSDWGAPSGHLHEWRIDLRSGIVRERTLSDAAVEFPRIDERRIARDWRYCYLTLEGLRSGIVKYDAASGACATRLYGKGRYGGEPVFVPRAQARHEDDGYLLAYVWDRDTNRSALHVLDAQSLDNEPVAIIELPVRVPFGFHGCFVRAADLPQEDGFCYGEQR